MAHSWCRTQTLQRHSFLWKCNTVSLYTLKRNFSYALTNHSMPAPVFTKLTNTRQHNLRLCYTECHRSLAINVESADSSSLSAVIKYGFHGVACQENKKNSINFSGHLLHRIIQKSTDNEDERQNLHLCP